MEPYQHLAKMGLYEPSTERAACGVGFIASLNGVRSHDIVHRALEILVHLEHRGACGCDPDTGDGAGILIQTPHEFLKDAAGGAGIRLPDLHEYGTGLVFLPSDLRQRAKCEQVFETVIAREEQQLLGWRDVPHNNEVIGPVARAVEPVVRQIFIGRGRGVHRDEAFERKLYVIRKLMEAWARSSGLSQARFFYVPSLSHRTLNYKGLLLAPQIEKYYQDLSDPAVISGIALVHQRYSTNTFPTWDLAQPFRFLCHNGEINTLRGNINWMHAREKLFKSPVFGEDMAKILPISTPGASDSAILDNAIELLYHTGRSLPHCIAMLIPEAWQNHQTMSDAKRAFYEYHSCLMEPWDGPASIAFTDGKVIGAVLDRNGLRPSRYMVTRDGYVIMSSETGVLKVDPADVVLKGRLEPGRMLLVDTDGERIVPDEEIKEELATRKPYRKWLSENLVRLTDQPGLSEAGSGHETVHPARERGSLQKLQRAFGYTAEDLRLIITPMANDGIEPVGSMGTDTPLAVFSNKAPLLYNYFKQLFAQVTNPPLDAIREELVTSSMANLGSEQDLFEETPPHCRQLRVEQPVLTDAELTAIRKLDQNGLRAITLPILFQADGGEAALRKSLDDLFAAASKAIAGGCTILILSDRGVCRERAAIPALLAGAGLHHHLIREGTRTRCGIVIESGEPREVHHVALLLAYGMGAVNPYLALQTLADMHAHGGLNPGLTLKHACTNYIKALNKGVIKVMSKMGISTLQSYRGAQIFEAVGLAPEVVDQYFAWTPSRIGGVGLNVLAREAFARHAKAFPGQWMPDDVDLESGGQYQWRRRGEYHLTNPMTVAKLQEAVRQESWKSYKEYSRLIDDQSRHLCTLRGLLEFKPADKPVPIEEVEPARQIVKRFNTGAMSFGSISFEAHANLAIAMNRIGGKSNTGEGGEDPIRYRQFPSQDDRRKALLPLSPWTAQNLHNGDSIRSSIKQVASGRFGVTSEYLVNADELQIKMAQGAKPGEGGQLPGRKVDTWIGKTRHSTPGVQLISPPPHHDIYSIEDLAQLIYDLKNANHHARISVKLVAEVGVGTVAAGVAKGKADLVLISGHDGGTGASPLTSIKHAGLPWELGVAETHQVLLANDLRSRIILETDGQLKTGRDVAIACLLGAEEFGFATAPLIASGCIMMRKCHLNTCPVGVATQDPELRRKFAGRPEHVINFMFYVAEELREIMAELGFRTINEMVGRCDRLQPRKDVDHWKARELNLGKLLYRPEVPASFGTYCQKAQKHRIEDAMDMTLLLEVARPTIERGERVYRELEIHNTDRTAGTITGSEITRRWGSEGLPEDTLHLKFTGSAGQSFAAFIPHGMTMEIEGDANDGFGKGLSGGRVIAYPPRRAGFVPEKNVLIGNVAFYGATGGEGYIRGLAGERFCVRNSGARAVVEGLGDHGCEYMTGGRAVVLGPTGRNFAAGMSGGIAYVFDETGDFARCRCNLEMVEIEAVTAEVDIAELRSLIERHVHYTGSTPGRRILDHWEECLPRFVKILPIEYKRVLEEQARTTRPAALSEPSRPEAMLEVSHG
ncbi:MAG TPA: glutamate synthase-related protein [Phycisphaerae bacterium]|nr:glutamate synthase-related protein [Phycisphaerae bacterium]HRY67743.1 glutamate synthase-related protein [Phycisphaerae bacterium]HSA25195.1 glutamate synthase-related protein [Phycisphaerae bacterium]